MLDELCKKYKAHKGEDKLSRYYLEAYEKHFGHRREEKLRLLEIGVQSGGSLRVWADYFPNAEIVGVDINENCMRHQRWMPERVKIKIGDQSSMAFLATLGLYDIIIDDGSHMMAHQKFTLTAMWHSLNGGGTYIIEDLETSYWPQFGGGYKTGKTTLDVLKKWIDYLNYQAARHERAGKSAKEFNKMGIKAIQFYPSICFIEKELKWKFS